jgi:hypothetical protein
MTELLSTKKTAAIAVLLAVVGVLSVGTSASAYGSEEYEEEKTTYSWNKDEHDDEEEKENDWDSFKHDEDRYEFGKHDKEDDCPKEEVKDKVKEEEKPEKPVVYEAPKEEQPPVGQVNGAVTQRVEQLPVTGPELFGQIAAASLAGGIAFVAARNRNE